MKFLFVSAICLILVPSLLVAERGGDARWKRSPSVHGLNGAVFRLVSLQGKLYAGGDFTEADGQPAQGIAEWNGSRWLPVASGLIGGVWAIAHDGQDLYVGGNFTIPSLGITNLARWDGHHWSKIGNVVQGMPCSSAGGIVFGMICRGKTLYIGGNFDSVGGVSATNVAAWDGRGWHSLGGGVRGECEDNGYGAVYCLAILEGRLYVGGRFRDASGVGATNIACWNGHGWSEVGGGLLSERTYEWNLENIPFIVYPGEVRDICVREKNLVVAGDFQRAGTLPVANLARWNGSSWEDIGGGVESSERFGANQVLSYQSDLIVCGSFLEPGGVPADYVARWDGYEWSPLRVELSALPLGLADWRGKLVVGGLFGVIMKQF